ncbi:3-oxoacyl-(acyl-carrier protein) reductase [Liberibacter crescens BT-1]|uniref:3-oxoacyl-[acyl-carrier-protein] reductase n=1 Tax=Liberibacter crescens (strain BT-1) TaxID=1215343 RepID=L0EU03_LIBCB|nr:3-oxoacyl-[acyl-carrier-protein] reductase [Liberibacter crescens]AGA65004.1 3-oxoacyl-(acyl-carrier protein) reductase [Liberibacter crescens BT-1]AMC13014.1 3-oxoacyl-ACP synthase [Liberibacter crescens]
MFDLTGKKAFVTGSTGSIGYSVAKILYDRGATVGLHGSRQDKLEKLCSEFGDRIKAFPADLSDRDAVKELGKKVELEMGGVDILINNAGITRDGLFLRMQDEDWDTVLDVNLTSIFILTRQLIHSMLRRRYGRIVNITSVVTVTGNYGQVNYCSSKAAIVGFSKALAQEVARRDVTVNCVAPGFVQSNMTEKLNEKQKERIISNIPMNRIATADEIASAVLYLSSLESSYITGQTIHVNGGMAMV